MKKFNAILLALTATLFAIGSAWLIKKFVFTSEKKAPFSTRKPERRSLAHIVNASGTLEMKNNVKVGSLVSGTIKELKVREHTQVTKGQLLAIINTGRGDTDIRETKATVDKAEAHHIYLNNHFKRAEQLYKKGLLTQDDYERKEYELKRAKAECDAAHIAYERATMAYENTHIVSPVSGTIVSVGVTEGMRVSTELESMTLFEITRDLKKMQAVLEIDESDVCHIKTNQAVKCRIDSLGNKSFNGVITDVSFSPKTKGGIQFFKALVDVDNSEQLLRPGISMGTRIVVNKAQNVICVPGTVFCLNTQNIERVAEMTHKKYKELSHKEKKAFEENNPGKHVRYLWLSKQDSFTETPVIVGISDDIYYEIIDGLTTHDEIIFDVEEIDPMSSIYKNLYRKKL